MIILEVCTLFFICPKYSYTGKLFTGLCILHAVKIMLVRFLLLKKTPGM